VAADARVRLHARLNLPLLLVPVGVAGPSARPAAPQADTAMSAATVPSAAAAMTPGPPAFVLPALRAIAPPCDQILES